MQKQDLWDWLEKNKAEIIAGRMVVDCFEFDDIQGAIDHDEAHCLKVIDKLNDDPDPEHGITWSVISCVSDEILVEERNNG